MSDEQAQKKESDLSKVKDEEAKKKEAGEKAAEERQKRLWTLTLILDPETWDFQMLLGDKVKKQGQVDILLNAAQKQTSLTAQARVIGEFVLRLLSAQLPKKKGLFRGR